MTALLLVVTSYASATRSETARPWPPISVTVSESDGVAREHWPVTFSVPFPRGGLHDAGGLVVVDERGAAAPVQARVLRRWPDGSVRWLLLDTRVTVGAGGSLKLKVEHGSAPPPTVPVRVTNAADWVEVDTGVVRFRVPKTRFAIVDDMRSMSGQALAVGPVTSFLTAGEKVGQAGRPSAVAVLEEGPLRTQVELRGTYGNGFDYVVRVEAYANQPFVRVLHTFISRSPTAFVSVSQVAIELPLSEAVGKPYRFGVVGEHPQSGILGEEGIRLYQPDNSSYQLNKQRSEGRLAGWLELRTTRLSVGLAARWFWEEYPKGVQLLPQRLTYNLWAPEARAAKAGVGAAKTHEFVFWAAPAKAVKREVAAGIARPLVAVVDPLWMARTGALAQAVAPAPAADGFASKVSEAAVRYLRRNSRERWNDCGAARCGFMGGTPRRGAYGMWNWGDWNFPGYEDEVKGTDAWGNLEYDTPQVLALSFAASGNPALHEAMLAATRHYMDVDIIHFYPRHPAWVGMNHPKNPLHFTFELGGVDLGHTWTEGLVSYFYLTGDRRGLEAARGIADYLVARLRGIVVLPNARQLAWPQIALLAVYDATGERAYLEAALEYARRGMTARKPTDVKHWKVGILADALAYTHAATGDAGIEAWLRQYVKTVTRGKLRRDGRMYPAVAYMASLTGDPALLAAARKRVRELKPGNWGKPFTINGRLGFRIYSLLAGRERAEKEK